MVRKNYTVSLLRILINDYMALLPALFPLLLWGVYFVLAIGSDLSDIRLSGRAVLSGDASIVLWMAIAASTAGLFGALWRVRFIKGVFNRGRIVKGEIIGIKKIRARGLQTSTRVRFKYSYDSKEFKRSNWLLSWDLEKDEGDAVDVILLADKPGKALLMEVYD